MIKQNILAEDLILNTILFANDQVIEARTENKQQRAVIDTEQYSYIRNLKVSVYKTKAVKRMMKVRTKIMINNNITKQVRAFNYLGYTITATNNRGLEIKMYGLIKCVAQ
jgi:hypothetical protein